MARLLKCYGFCHEKYEKSELTNYKSKNYCSSCLKQKKIDDEGRDTLHKVIMSLFNIPFPNGQMLRQMKMFREERNYDYEDQAKALLYAKHQLKKTMHPKYGLGLVPYVIDDAVKYHKEQTEKLEEMKNKDTSYETNVLYVKPKEIDLDIKRKEKIIDMEDIL